MTYVANLKIKHNNKIVEDQVFWSYKPTKQEVIDDYHECSPETEIISVEILKHSSVRK